ncbi:MAG: Rieske 2Fe-2S domain-containing protein [Nitratireductor sp.]
MPTRRRRRLKQPAARPNWTGIEARQGCTQCRRCEADHLPSGEPLLLVRDRDNQVRVSRIRRHRGVVLVDEAKNTTGLIRCPYHAWC